MLQHDSDKYWYAWHLRQKKMYTQGNIELDREMIFDYCTEAFRAKETRIETVIEIGVGNAYLLNRLNQLQPRIEYIGIDRNRPILIKNSREFPELKFIHGDAVKVIEGIKTGRFVFIYSIATLEYLPEAEISQLFRVIQQNFNRGLFVFSGTSGPDDMFNAANSILIKNSPNDIKYAHNYQKFCLKNNLKIVDGKIIYRTNEHGKKSTIHVFTLDLSI